MTPSHWLTPPDPLKLPAGEVHVWRATLEPPAAVLARLGRLLAPDELARAARFTRVANRDAYVAARGTLRTLLASYLDDDPARLHFAYNDHGKPRLAAPDGLEPLRFNLSHSGGLALVAVTRDGAVGVDVERIKPLTDRGLIAERFFSPREVRALRALPEHLQEQAFFTIWTRKEAYIKGRGLGLALPLDHFDVSPTAGTPVTLTHAQPDAELDRWRLRELLPGDGYVGALAVEGEVFDLRCWQWTA